MVWQSVQNNSHDVATEVGRAEHEQSENFNKETEDIKRYQTEIRALKYTIAELKNSTERFNSRVSIKWKTGSPYLKVCQWKSTRGAKRKGMKRHEGSLRDSWNTINVILTRFFFHFVSSKPSERWHILNLSHNISTFYCKTATWLLKRLNHIIH